MVYDGPLEGLIDYIVWGTLKPTISRHLAHPNESIQTSESSDEANESDPSVVERPVRFQEALLKWDEIGKVFDRGMDGAKEIIQRYPKDSLGRALYSFKEVHLVAIEVGVHRVPSTTNPIAFYSNGPKRVYDGTPREAKLSTKIQVTSFKSKKSSL